MNLIKNNNKIISDDYEQKHFHFSNDHHFQFIELQQKKEAENKEFESEFTATTALVKDTVFTKEYVSQIRSLKISKLELRKKAT